MREGQRRGHGRSWKEVMEGHGRSWKEVMEGHGRRSWTVTEGQRRSWTVMDGRGRSWKVVEGHGRRMRGSGEVSAAAAVGDESRDMRGGSSDAETWVVARAMPPHPG